MHSKLTFLTISILILSLHLAAQDMMYKTNGGKIQVQVVNKTSQYLSYRLSGSRDSILYYISTSGLDSVIFANGTKDLYALRRKTETTPGTIQEIKYGRNLIGTDVASLIFKNTLAFSYEYFIWNRSLGIKALFGFNLSDKGYYDDNWYNGGYKKGQFARIGLNWYFFPPGSFRVGTGLYFYASKYHIYGEQTIYNPDPPYDTTIKKIDEYRKYRNIGLTFFVFYQITKNLAINSGFDFPNNSPDEINTVFRSEILLNF
jgi:hypothetical protein